jgi:hypothetical protein
MSQLEYSNFREQHHKFKYDTREYDFQGVLCKIFDDWSQPIETLHNYFNNSESLKQITIDEDTKTIFHKKYYNSPHYEELLNLYYTFVREVVLPLFKDDEEFVVQKDPAFRINLPNNTALGFRPNMGDPEDKIGIHCDADYAHPEGEINFMLTFGKQYGNNSCFVETAPGSEDYYPIEMEFGEFVSFYGNKCRHFNRVNNTGVSRISIDFRVMPISKYDPVNTSQSLHGKRKFLIGDYYIAMKK